MTAIEERVLGPNTQNPQNVGAASELARTENSDNIRYSGGRRH
jgi:hypothetical protein